MSDLYILDASGEKPMRCEDIGYWAEWFERHHLCRVDATYLANGRIFVSTVFLGVDHSLGSGTPILWETMVFEEESSCERECMRCAGTREHAEAMHAAMLERVEAVLALDDGIPLKA